jgi:hypothetical protein
VITFCLVGRTQTRGQHRGKQAKSEPGRQETRNLRCCQRCTGCKIKTGTKAKLRKNKNEQRENKDRYGAISDSSHLIRTEIEFLWAMRKPETRPDQNRAEIEGQEKNFEAGKQAGNSWRPARRETTQN